MPTPVPPSRRANGSDQTRAPMFHWPAIAGALVAAVLLVGGVILFLKHQERRDAEEQAAQRRDLAPDQKEELPSSTPEELLPFGDKLAWPGDNAPEVQRVLGHGISTSAPSELLDLAPPRHKATSSAPPKRQPKENPPTEPKPQPPPKPPIPPPATADELFEKRLHQSEQELRARLLDVPELRLLRDEDMQNLRDLEAKTAAVGGADAINYAFNVKVQLAFRQAAAKAGLPLQFGPRAQLDRVSAADMQQLSTQLRNMGFVSVPGVAANVTSAGGDVSQVGGTTLAGGSPPQKVGAFKTWCNINNVEKFRGALATMLQMLQVEDAPTRRLLVKELAKVNGPVTSAVLAMRAVADLAPEVRMSALESLRKRPAAEYLPVLLLGLRYPWAPIADHAAYALVQLKPDGAVPKLLDLLDQPDPSVPVLDKKTNKPMVKEMVRLNHLRNCLLCHPPSANANDLVRGAVPTPGKPMLTGGYGAATASGDFVRADITFLRQDFSVSLPVKDADPWPDDQRFDFVTRVRPVKPEEMLEIAAKPSNYAQREAVLYALRGLSGKDGGDSTDKWRELLSLATDKDANLDQTGTPSAEKGGPDKEKRAPLDKIEAPNKDSAPRP